MLKLKLVVLAALLLCLAQCGPPATPVSPRLLDGVPAPPPVVKAGWTSHTNANNARAIAFDGQGNVWAGGSGGLVKWNVAAQTYTRFGTENGLPLGDIESIAVAPDGALWIAGDGLARFDGQAWVTYTEQDGLEWSVAHHVAVAPDGLVWIGTEATVSRYDGRTWTTYSTGQEFPPDSRVKALVIASDGSALVSLFGGKESWLCRFDGRAWTTYPSDDVISMAAAPDGTVWLATWDGIGRFNVRTGRSTTVRRMRGVQSLAVTQENTLWASAACGFENEVAGIWQHKGSSWRRYQSEGGFIDCGARVIAVAPDGQVWLGTGEGLSRIDGEAWPTYRIADAIGSNSLDQVRTAPDGDVWGITGAIKGQIYAYRLKGQTWSAYTLQQNTPPDVIIVGTLIPLPGGQAWYGSTDGVLHFDGSRWNTAGLQGQEVMAMEQAPDGTLWAMTYSSVAHLQGQTWTSFTHENGLPPGYVDGLNIGPDGLVWIARVDKGPARFDGQSWVSYSTPEHLPDGDWDVVGFGSDGSVWATSRGSSHSYRLARFDGQAWAVQPMLGTLDKRCCQAAGVAPDGRVWLVYDAKFKLHAAWFDGQTWTDSVYPGSLRDASTRDVLATEDGRLWLATTHDGILVLDGDRWSAYTAADGLAGNTVNSMTRAPDGALWFGTESGLSRYQPGE